MHPSVQEWHTRAKGKGHRRARLGSLLRAGGGSAALWGRGTFHLVVRLARLELPALFVRALLRQRVDLRVARDRNRIIADVDHALAGVLAVAVSHFPFIPGAPVDGHEFVGAPDGVLLYGKSN